MEVTGTEPSSFLVDFKVKTDLRVTIRMLEAGAWLALCVFHRRRPSLDTLQRGSLACRLTSTRWPGGPDLDRNPVSAWRRVVQHGGGEVSTSMNA